MYKKNLLLGLLFWSTSYASHVLVILENSSADYFLNSDGSYTLTSSLTQKLTSSIAVREGQHSTIRFDPSSESVRLLEAYTITPDGKKIEVLANKVFVRPSQASQDTPGFTNSQTASIIFPQLQLNSRTYSKWEITKKTGPFGFLEMAQPPFFPQVNNYHVSINVPVSMPLYWAASADFVTTEKTINGRRMISADLKTLPAHTLEPHMVAQSDVLPYFEASSTASWIEFAEIWGNSYNKQIVITPIITELAKSIVQNKTGLDAVKALYLWELQHITYVDIINSESARYTPNTPVQILNNGYGDCKDYSMLLIAFLKTIGIEADVAMISDNNAYRQYPLPTTLAINHAIVYLPKYHLFLNPTNKDSVFGQLDTWLSNKFALVLAPTPFVTTTQHGSPEQNRFTINTEEELLENGTINGHNTMEIAGHFVELIKSEIENALSDQALAQQFLEMTPDGGFGSLIPLNLTQIDKPLRIKSQWASPEAVAMQKGTTYFPLPIGVNPFASTTFHQYIQNSPRHYPLVIGAANYHWHSELTLPKNFHAVLLPEDTKFLNKAGTYLSRATGEGNHIVIDRSLTINQDVYSAEEYPALRQLLYQPLIEYRRIYGIANDKDQR